MKKNTLVVASVCWMLVLVVFATAFLTMQVMGYRPQEALLSGLDQASEQAISGRYARLEEVRQILMTEYYKDLDEDELVLGAIRGMMASVGDPYTYYSTPEEREASLSHMQGSYEGVGLVVGMDEGRQLAVLRVFPDTSAAAAGIQPGDRILQVNGTPVSAETKKDMDEAVALIKNAADPNIKLGLLRGGDKIDVSVTRGPINQTRTAHKMLENGIGYIVIYEFLGDDVVGFERALNELQQQGMKALIMDVRNNPGGYLQHVVAIADRLLPEGLVVYTENRADQREEYFSDPNCLDIPMAILINGMSASASEVLSGALQDYGKAVVVGETTFGKGIVQEPIPFQSDGAEMQLTIASYFTPKGRSLHGVGVVPDEEVKLTEGVNLTQAELDPNQDAQLQRAVQLMNEQLKME